ncbi:MAG: hypothetical protein ISS76_05840 [Phycisphaerae bacterium]|nr:hypothetical protein [Phycisphaerae bacterium]
MTIYEMLITKYQRPFTNDLRLLKIYHPQGCTKEFVRNFQLFMQNKANFGNDKMNINTFVIIRYVIFMHLAGSKNKANSNPIQSQFNPKQTQFKANKAKNKPNSNPIPSKFTTIKGANFNGFLPT